MEQSPLFLSFGQMSLEVSVRIEKIYASKLRKTSSHIRVDNAISTLYHPNLHVFCSKQFSVDEYLDTCRLIMEEKDVPKSIFVLNDLNFCSNNMLIEINDVYSNMSMLSVNISSFQTCGIDYITSILSLQNSLDVCDYVLTRHCKDEANF